VLGILSAKNQIFFSSSEVFFQKLNFHPQLQTPRTNVDALFPMIAPISKPA
jgi:hypothetical protein